MKNKINTLKQQWAEEDNDLKAFGIGKQIIREERVERFEESWLAKFKERFGDNIKYDTKLFAWRIRNESVDLAYYPKANKVFDYLKNKWIEKGLKFLIKTFITK